MSTSPYPSNIEVRRWAEAKGLPVHFQGMLPLSLIKAWDRAHPDRPFVKSEARHGTFSGYAQGCRCDPCLETGRGREREARRARRADKEWDDNGAL
jgi:hypothetical protein